MVKMYKTQHRRQEIKKLNRSARQKQRRLKKLYDVDVDLTIKSIDDFESGDAYKAYVKNLKKFTDYNTMRYTRVGRDVVPLEEVKELQETNKRRNKINRQRMAQDLKIIRKETGVDIYLKDIDKNPLLARDLNLGAYLPLPETISEIKERYTTAVSIPRAIEQSKKVAQPNYNIKTMKTYYNNFIQGVYTEFSGFEGHGKLITYTRKKGYKWLHARYITGQIPVFDYVYSFGDLETRFIMLMESFGFIFDNQNQEWYHIEDLKKDKNKGIYKRNKAHIKQMERVKAQEIPMFKYRMRYRK